VGELRVGLKLESYRKLNKMLILENVDPSVSTPKHVDLT
jgi:hypothetical protein